MWMLMQSVGEVATLFPVHGGFVEVKKSISCKFELVANLGNAAL